MNPLNVNKKKEYTFDDEKILSIAKEFIPERPRQRATTIKILARNFIDRAPCVIHVLDMQFLITLRSVQITEGRVHDVHGVACTDDQERR